MKIKVLLILSLLIVNGYAAERVVGPWVVQPAKQTATIAWITETSQVKVGMSPDQLTRTIPVLHYEKISLTGLKPDETIYYDAFGSDQGAGHFKTPPPPGTPFHFVVFGDTRTRDALHRRIVAAIVKENPDFVVHTGDLVQNGYDTAQWPNFFEIEHELLRQTVFFPVLGNHERDNPQFSEFFDLKNPYYSFDWGSAHFALIDGDVANTGPDVEARERFWNEQKQWLEDDLEHSQNSQFRFVVMHEPPFTVNHQHPNHVSAWTPTLVPMFEKYHVTAVFAGHDHNYQHHLKDGIHYVVTGGGGAPLAPADKPLPGITLKVESVEHFVRIRVNGERASVEAVALDGQLIDNFDLTGSVANSESANKWGLFGRFPPLHGRRQSRMNRGHDMQSGRDLVRLADATASTSFPFLSSAALPAIQRFALTSSPDRLSYVCRPPALSRQVGAPVPGRLHAADDWHRSRL